MMPSGQKQWCQCVVFVAAAGLLLQTCLWIRDYLPLNHLPSAGNTSSISFLSKTWFQSNGSVSWKPSTASNVGVQSYGFDFSKPYISSNGRNESNGSILPNTRYLIKDSFLSNTPLLPKPVNISNTPLLPKPVNTSNTPLLPKPVNISNTPLLPKPVSISNTPLLPKPVNISNSPFQPNKSIPANSLLQRNGSIASNTHFQPRPSSQLNTPLLPKPLNISNTPFQPNRSILINTLLQPNRSILINTLSQPNRSIPVNTLLQPNRSILINTLFQPNRSIPINTLLQPNGSIVSNTNFQSKAPTQSNTQLLTKPSILFNTQFQSNRLTVSNAPFTSNRPILSNTPLQSNRQIYPEPPIRSVVKTSSQFPLWERPRQFLDQVAEFKITNEDPLAMTLSVKQPNSQRKYKPRQSLRTPKQHRKKVLVMNNPGWDWIQMGNISLDDCPVECTLTTNPAELETSDAVILYAVAWPRSSPPRRPARQVWIFFSLESPTYSLSSGFNNPAWHGQINWTMTYRHDSDIFYPYGRVNRRADPLSTNYTSLAEKKTHQVAWFVSHCSTQSRREDYANTLKRYMKVDIYGACGSQRCGPEGSYECLQMLTNKYKFYLSFENTLCNDYVTEKIFRKVMISDIVPIVYGRVNYTRYLPPKSFINVADFDSMDTLGRYLNYLDKNVTAYAEYLEWKKYYFVVEKPNPTCEVCMKLTEPEKYRNVYEDVYAWWTKDQCTSPKPVV